MHNEFDNIVSSKFKESRTEHNHVQFMTWQKEQTPLQEGCNAMSCNEIWNDVSQHDMLPWKL